ncbi:odorant receptor 33a-like isoform X2 [Anoplolepis gracilipes]|uniref:odorant receptor 33a-like isoform X2 n=1 Tax=Anoplolepis gracilipes TaxID=354296 RepID=UPI003B9EFF41
MRILQCTFKILTFIGCWRPESWSSLYMRIFYDAYTVFMIILLYTFLVSQFFDIIWNVDNAEEFTENFYATLASVVSCSKMLSLLVNRNNIHTLTNILVEKPYKPLDINEMKIRYKFDKLIYTNTFIYITLVETTCICITMTSLVTEFRKRNLTFRAWLPYDYNSSTIVFCFTYAHQLISLTAGSLVNVACDSLICGLLVHICCQIEILEYRLSKVSNDHNNLRDCVCHHDGIFKYALRLNHNFNMTIAMQFISTQLINNIFGMNWLTMDKDLKGGLLIIMNRAIIPIEFTSAYVLSMNLDSFVGILKTSYSVYNLLKQV